MAWTLTHDVAGFLDAAGPFLSSRAAEHTVLLTVSETVRLSGPAAFGDDLPLFGWYAADGGPVTAACLHTPPYPLALTAMPDEVAAALAPALAGRGRELAGVDGRPGPAHAFAAGWLRQTGQPAHLGRRTRLYRLGDLVPPGPAPPGQDRAAAPADTELLVAWLAAFQQEADSTGGPVRRQIVAERLSYGGFTLWETGDGPVSLAGRTRVVAGQARVGPVYTPPEHRGRGYGGAVTAAVSRQALAAGASEVLLYTDLANPTSNALYPRLGYQPVSDSVRLSFTA
ncbi:MAG TPA: GNAT family N-acetyltransferase [Streptosporangiaceae bacterium]